MEEITQTNRSLAIGLLAGAWEGRDGVFTHRESQVTVELPASEIDVKLTGSEINRIVFKIREAEGHGGILSCGAVNLNYEAKVWRWALNDRDRLARDCCANRDFRDSIVEKAHLTGYPHIWLIVFQHDAQMVQDIKESPPS